uniref:Nucleotidyltransferase n=1 Tax=Cyanothece sp. (strain PCC 7425 / ATCC 29141) TaxID=395961 RepID=B8HS66_CYAP4
MSRDQQSIQDIWNAAQEILSFTAGMDYESLVSDRRTQVAVLYEILIIGEAANRLSPEFRSQRPTVPWKDIIGMRNIVVHQYDQVDTEVVWDVICQDIPELINLIQPLL